MGCQMMGIQTFIGRFGLEEGAHRVTIPRSHSHDHIPEQRLWLRESRDHKGFWAWISNHQLLAQNGMRDFDLQFPWATPEARQHHRIRLTAGIPRADVFLFSDAITAFKFKMRWA